MLHNKAKLLLFFVFCFCNILIYAQQQSFPISVFGAKAGYNIGQVHFNPRVNQEYFQAYNAGVMFKYISQAHLGIQIELNYSQKGWSEFDKYDESHFYKRTNNYLEVPFISHFYLGNRNSRFVINVGSFGSYLISESTEYSEDKYSTATNRPWEFGIVAGLGFEKITPVGGFMLELRITHGLTNIIQREKPKSTDYSQTQVASVNICYFLEFPKRNTEGKKQEK